MSIGQISKMQSTVNQVRDICSILFKNTEITYFYFAKVYDDGRVTFLSTNGSYQNHFLNNHHYKIFFSALKPGILFNEKYCIDALDEAKYSYNLDHMLMIVNRYEDHYEILCFATNKDNDNILYFYLHNLDILQKFGLYFKDRVSKLIKHSEKKYIQLENYTPNIPNKTDSVNFCRTEFLKKISDRKYYFINPVIENVSISKRQAQILQLSIRGKTVPNIAIELGLSKRTVGHYLDTIKSKMRVESKSELIEKVIDYFK